MTNDRSHPAVPTLTHAISPADFAAWGTPGLAFVKRVVDDSRQVSWAIHAADGTPLGVAPSRAIAFAAIVQHELEPVSVH